MDAKKRIDFSIIRLDRGTQKIENLFPLILYIGLDGKILDCSSHSAETLGYRNKKELSGKPLITTICAPSSREKAGTLFLEWQKTGQLKNEQLQIVTREGRELDVLMNMDAILDKRDDPLYAVVTLWNMTEQRRMIDRFKRLAHDLGERTKELNLLYSIDEISRKQEITIDEVLQRTVQLIPPA
ncbi:MAG: PAS domain S-box protein, partial [Candidatus Aminicenantales bacterium]